MESDQEEADCRKVLHLHDVVQKSNVVIKGNDADVLIILLGNIQKFQQKNIWMEVGLITNNTLRYIIINLIAENSVMQLCKALPAFHVFTGCDNSLAFVG